MNKALFLLFTLRTKFLTLLAGAVCADKLKNNKMSASGLTFFGSLSPFRNLRNKKTNRQEAAERMLETIENKSKIIERAMLVLDFKKAGTDKRYNL